MRLHGANLTKLPFAPARSPAIRWVQVHDKRPRWRRRELASTLPIVFTQSSTCPSVGHMWDSCFSCTELSACACVRLCNAVACMYDAPLVLKGNDDDEQVINDLTTWTKLSFTAIVRLALRRLHAEESSREHEPKPNRTRKKALKRKRARRVLQTRQVR